MNIVKVLLLVVVLFIGYKIYKMIQRAAVSSFARVPEGSPPARGEELVQDPFCKTYVPKSQAIVSDIHGRREYFCSKECRDKYLSDPSK